jgi:hypothetical protein
VARFGGISLTEYLKSGAGWFAGDGGVKGVGDEALEIEGETSGVGGATCWGFTVRAFDSPDFFSTVVDLVTRVDGASTVSTSLLEVESLWKAPWWWLFSPGALHAFGCSSSFKPACSLCMVKKISPCTL